MKKQTGLSAFALALIRWIRQPTWPAIAALALLEAAGLWTHYSFVFVVLVLNLAFLASPERGRLRRWVRQVRTAR